MFINQVVRRELCQQARNNQTQHLRVLQNRFTTFSPSQSIQQLPINTTSNTNYNTHPTTTSTQIYSNQRIKYFSSEAADNLASLLSREIDDEDSTGNNVVPNEVKKLKTLIEKDWRIVEKPGVGAITLYKKVNPDGMKIAIQFHCQDTETPETEGPDEDDDANEDEEEGEAGGNLRFMVCCNKAGKNIVIGCATEGGQADIETVVIRDGETVDEGFVLRGTENLYQGPEFFDLASDLQEAFNVHVQEDCGVDESVSAFLVMYTDFKEQVEYTHWLKTVHDIMDK